jgi:hypothetical protein
MNFDAAAGPIRGEDHVVLADAERLVAAHGDQADIVAAQLADSSFRAGDETAGVRWIKIFRLIAASHIRHARERLGTGAFRYS